uniref:Charged multivesicular body protein 2Ba n=1 Tax=Astyanax mexicanus TaxID=7994 RepID=A0A8B9JEA1_ASTMX
MNHDIIKEQSKELRGTQRQITRDRAALEKQEKQMEMEIKKMAKTGNREACKILAKQLVQLRKQKNRTYAVSSKVTSMSTQTKVMNSQMKMAGAMSTTAKTMQTVNKKMDPKKTLQTMQDFQKENLKMEMTEDMINDTLDEIFNESGDEEECQDIVNQVLDEIGIEISGKVKKLDHFFAVVSSTCPYGERSLAEFYVEQFDQADEWLLALPWVCWVFCPPSCQCSQLKQMCDVLPWA